ncbi:MAG: carbonic anhydrase, partial [Micromonosporaceae bacterium]
DPGSALRRLLAGNGRFVAGRQRHPRQSRERLRELAHGQHPYAITLGCADSRVPPELLFDQGLGDIFDQRVAGNVIDDLMLGSIEFGIEEFGSPLLLVLGHERCGAITATVEAIRTGHTPPGHIGAIVEVLRPVVEPVMDRPGDPVENGVRANVRAVVKQLRQRSHLVQEKIKTGELRVYGARYDLDTGRVTLLR